MPSDPSWLSEEGLEFKGESAGCSKEEMNPSRKDVVEPELKEEEVKKEDVRSKSSKKKHKNERRNIKDVLDEEKLADSTLEAKAQESDRLRRLEELAERQRQMLEQLNGARKAQVDQDDCLGEPVSGKSQLRSFSSHQEVIDLSSDSEDDQEPKSKRNKSNVAIDVDSDDDEEDDDVVVLSDNEAGPYDDEDEDEEDNDPSVSGMHTDDRLNVPDANDRVLINVGHSDSEPAIFLTDHLVKVLKPHQIGGVRFLYDNIVENKVQFETTSGFGCVLAHAMGLGKTLQVVAFCDVYLRHTKGRHVLIVVPINTIQNWVTEFDTWLPPKPPDGSDVTSRVFDVFVLNETLKNLEQRCRVTEAWKTKGGVLLMGYELYRLLANKKLSRKRKSKKDKEKKIVECVDIEEEDLNKTRLDVIHSALVDPGPSLIICDEGHRIKNCLASISNALKAIKTRRRVVLTGYPLQNNLQEYWCMVDFVRPNFLGTRTEFSNMFERPIANGQCVDSTPKDVRLMRHRAHVLHSQLKGFVQRRGHRVLKHALPTKYEHVLLVRMTPFQRKLYKAFMDEITFRKAVSNPLKAFAVCSKIWNHPDILYNHIQLKASLAADDDLELEEITHSKKTKTVGEGNNDQLANKLTVLDSPSMSGFDPFGASAASKKDEISYDWAGPLLSGYEPGLLCHSPKLMVFMGLLEETLKADDRMLLFSQSLCTLSLIEHFLQTSNIPGTCHPWRPGESYYRLDGSTSGLERERLIKSFNSTPSVLLFIVSTRAGSLGVNLVGANRVVVLDASWNPCHDSQAVCRVYRYGQRKPCHIYRLITDNCIERKIYDRQINKQGMSDRVVDELNPDNHISSKDIASLISDNEKDPEQPLDLDPQSVKRDYEPVLSNVMLRLGGELLTQSPFAHESLLVDRKEKRLTKAEKRLAERTYALEKNSRVAYTRPSYVAFYPNNNTSMLTANSSAGGPYFDTGSFGNCNSTAFVRRQQYQKLYNANPITDSTPMEASATPSSTSATSLSSSSSGFFSSSPASSSSLSLDVLRCKAGVSVQEVSVPKEMIIPTNTVGQPPIKLCEGQKVVVIHTPKGFYLKMDEKIIKVKMPDTMRAAAAAATVGPINNTEDRLENNDKKVQES